MNRTMNGTTTTARDGDRTVAAMTVGGLATGAVLGLGGEQFPVGSAHVLMLLLSSVGLVVATALLAYRHLRRGRALVGAGFGILTVAEMLMWSTGGPLVGGHGSFAAAVAFYLPALLLISVPPVLPVWARAAGVLAAVPFGTLATIALAGGTPAAALQDAGYALLTVALIGWALEVVRGSGPRAADAHRQDREPAR